MRTKIPKRSETNVSNYEAMNDGFFPIGARVYIDGRDEAIVKQVFPEGSASFLFPHYKVDVVGGDENVTVSMKRVSTLFQSRPHDIADTRKKNA